MNVEDAVTTADAGEPLAALGRLVRAEGVDLLDARPDELARGTPVYVDGGADLLAVQRRMAECHVRRVLVVRGDDVVGILDLVELALGDACSRADAGPPVVAPRPLLPEPHAGA